MPRSNKRSRPTPNIEAFISLNQTCASGLLPQSAALANAAARSPVPPAISKTFCPGRTFARAIVIFFQTRCNPNDMKSFITSYLLATE